MAARNKKGKLHGIFKSQFQISFFYKPSMEGSDIYYYMILDDIIFLKLRFIKNTTLVIEDLHPLTTSYLEKEYEKLFNFLKEQTSITVLVSIIGNIGAFRQTCLRFNAPVIEDERFLSYPESFYQKFKNYCGNDIDRFGFFLLALNESTFKEESIEKELGNEKPKEQTTVVINDVEKEIKDTEKDYLEAIPSRTFNEEYSIANDFLKKWISLCEPTITDRLTIHQLQKRVPHDPDFELNLDNGNNDCGRDFTSFLLTYEVTDMGYSFYINNIVGKNTSVLNIISLLRSLILSVDEFYKEGTHWAIFIPVSQESQIHQLLGDLRFRQIYNTGNYVTVNVNNRLVQLNNRALMVYEPPQNKK